MSRFTTGRSTATGRFSGDSTTSAVYESQRFDGRLRCDRPLGRVRWRSVCSRFCLFVTLVCLALAWLVQPKRRSRDGVVSSVRDADATVDGDRQYDRTTRFEILKKTQLALLKSNFVLTAAIRKPGIAALPIFAGQAGPGGVAAGESGSRLSRKTARFLQSASRTRVACRRLGADRRCGCQGIQGRSRQRYGSDDLRSRHASSQSRKPEQRSSEAAKILDIAEKLASR